MGFAIAALRKGHQYRKNRESACFPAQVQGSMADFQESTEHVTDKTAVDPQGSGLSSWGRKWAREGVSMNGRHLSQGLTSTCVGVKSLSRLILSFSYGCLMTASAGQAWRPQGDPNLTEDPSPRAWRNPSVLTAWTSEPVLLGRPSLTDLICVLDLSPDSKCWNVPGFSGPPPSKPQSLHAPPFFFGGGGGLRMMTGDRKRIQALDRAPDGHASGLNGSSFSFFLPNGYDRKLPRIRVCMDTTNRKRTER